MRAIDDDDGAEDAATPGVADFLARYARGWAEPASGRLADIWHVDSEMLHPELEAPVRGWEAIQTYLAKFLDIWPDLRVRPLAHAAEGDTLFVHWEASATIDGCVVVWQGVDRFDLEDGRARRGIGFFDTFPIRRAMADAR